MRSFSNTVSFRGPFFIVRRKHTFVFFRYYFFGRETYDITRHSEGFERFYSKNYFEELHFPRCVQVLTIKTCLLFLSVNYPPQIKITSAIGDAAAGNKAQYKIEHAYDRDMNLCYIPGTNKNSQAKFQIANSLVAYVRILNRLDCCREYIMITFLKLK